MDFSLNRFNNHHPQPRAAAVVDLMMMESSPSSPSPPLPPISSSSVFELEEATTAAVVGSRVEDSDNDDGIRIGIGSNCCSTDHAEKEHMFDKVVTPSDVGKLNRLVIPKQHAERFFPLNSSTNEKGLLLNFEDRNGKSWRFRYSYWNSSQSYVMTKGWSRFVKEKRLDAGDIVSFERGVGELARDRLFIDWRRRPEHPPSLRHNLMQLPPHAHGQFSCRPSIVPSAAWSSLVWRPTGPYPPVPRDHMHLSPLNNNSTIDWSNSYGRSGGYSYGYGSVVKPESAESAVYYLRSGMEDGRGGGVSPQLVEGQEIGMLRQRQIPTSDDGGDGGGGDGAVIYESMPMVVQGNLRTPKRSRLRLFGVNMECPISSAASSDECDLFLSSSNHTTPAISSSTTQFPPPSPPSPHG